MKEKLKTARLSYRQCGALFPCCFTYLSDVLNGRTVHPARAFRLRLGAWLDDYIASKEATDLRGGETRQRG